MRVPRPRDVVVLVARVGRLKHQAVEAPEKSGESFAGAGGSKDKSILSARNDRPAHALRSGGGVKDGTKPLSGNRMKTGKGVVNRDCGVDLSRGLGGIGIVPVRARAVGRHRVSQNSAERRRRVSENHVPQRWLESRGRRRAGKSGLAKDSTPARKPSNPCIKFCDFTSIQNREHSYRLP